MLLLRTLGFPPAFAASLPAARRFETSYWIKNIEEREEVSETDHMIRT